VPLLAVISDTHLPRGDRVIPPECLDRMRRADWILHAGDIASVETLRELQALGPPVVAIYGNVDPPELREELPKETALEVGGVTIAMTHNGGPAANRLARMRKRFPEADAVIFGHSHIPQHERDGDFQIFNPGSATDRRKAPTHTMGEARIDDGEIAFELIHLD
jgi:putative phosphoesterase